MNHALSPAAPATPHTPLGLFRKSFRNFEAHHEELRVRLERPSFELEDAMQSFRPTWLAGLDELAERDSVLKASERMRAVDFVRASRLMRWALEAPYYKRIFHKPRGYAGDAEMMRYIYRAGFEGDSRWAQLYHRLATSVREAQAVRNRRTLLRDALMQQPTNARVLSLACGPCTEIFDVLRRYDAPRISVLALDHDVETLREVNARARFLPSGARDRLRLGLANALRMIRGTPRAFLPRNLATADPERDLRGLRLLAARVRYQVRRIPHESQDLVYSAGLFDYLWTHPNDDRRGAAGLAKKLFDLVKPGGELIIGNFGPSVSRGTRFFMEYVCDWHLILRGDAELRALARPMNNKASVIVDREPEGINLFLRVRKLG